MLYNILNLTCMILTNCAACAAPLGLALGKKCGRCSTRYCGPACQEQHWKGCGHDKLCKKIKKSGGAEQYHAEKKHAEAVADAAEACAEDTKGQTCYICTETVHWKTKEGLVRMYACRGTAGFAHVSCLAEQAKILVEEAEENNLDGERSQSRWLQWSTCSMCEQDHQGGVSCALGWACWKTYLGRPEADQARQLAMGVLGNGLRAAKKCEECLIVFESQLNVLQRHWRTASTQVLSCKGNLATCYTNLGRLEAALVLEREVYSAQLTESGVGYETLTSGLNLSISLTDLKKYSEARTFTSERAVDTIRVLGRDHDITLALREQYAGILYEDDAASRGDVTEAVAVLGDVATNRRRVFGSQHPYTVNVLTFLERARMKCEDADAPETRLS